MIDALAQFALLAGAALPLAGLGATVGVARRLRGGRRWAALALGPGLTLALCGAVAEPVFRHGPAAAGTLYILFAFALALYYPGLALLWLVRNRFGGHGPGRGP